MPTDLTAARAYVERLNRELRVGGNSEHAHRPALKTFLEDLRHDTVAVNEPGRVECGAPDFAIRRGRLTLGFVEAKDIGTPLSTTERTDQLRRYRQYIRNLVLTDYVEFRWFADGERRATASIADIDDRGKLQLNEAGAARVVELLTSFLRHEPEPVRNSRALAEHMARHSHLIRDIVLQAFELGRASRDLQDFRTALALTLLPEVGEDENLPEFADVYAQTLVYGLFAAWTNHREGEFRRQGAAAEIPRTAPLLRRIFETLTGTALDDEPHAPFVNDLVAIFQAADQKSVLRDFAQGLGHDPVVHFYETFLSEYDPKLREKRGVYYTPTPVVSYIVRSIDSILQRDFALADGLADHSLVELTRRVVEDGPSKGTTIVREFREKRYRL